MLSHLAATIGGAGLCAVLLYALGKRHLRHSGRDTGPNSRVPVSESVVPIVKKG